MKTLRTVLFWLHLASGLVAGSVIGIMCLTGTLLAFETEITAWAERDARVIVVPGAGTVPLSLDVLRQQALAAQPGLKNPTIALNRSSTAAVGFGSGREITAFADPFTGQIRTPASTSMRTTLRTVLEWHRYLGRGGEQRPVGKAITGACNATFAFLAASGLFLWMPRKWSRQGVKAIALLNLKLAGRSRDFNWHNAIGVWSAPVLIVLTLTALPISYRWAADGIYRLAGEVPPAPGNAAQTPVREKGAQTPSPGAGAINFEALANQTREKFPGWEQISLRPGEKPGAPLIVTIRERGTWPRTATTTLTLNPFTGEELSREGFRDFTAGRQIRTWTRFLHTGQALGWTGQFVAGVACLSGCFLVFTGFALSWRRFFFKSKPASPAGR